MGEAAEEVEAGLLLNPSDGAETVTGTLGLFGVLRHVDGDGVEAILFDGGENHAKPLGNVDVGVATACGREGLGARHQADNDPDGADAFRKIIGDKSFEDAPRAPVELGLLRRDIRHQEGLFLGGGPIIGGDGVVGRQVAAIVA